MIKDFIIRLNPRSNVYQFYYYFEINISNVSTKELFKLARITLPRKISRFLWKRKREFSLGSKPDKLKHTSRSCVSVKNRTEKGARKAKPVVE